MSLGWSSQLGSQNQTNSIGNYSFSDYEPNSLKLAYYTMFKHGRDSPSGHEPDSLIYLAILVLRH